VDHRVGALESCLREKFSERALISFADPSAWTRTRRFIVRGNCIDGFALFGRSPVI
jgi:hypothetical protein